MTVVADERFTVRVTVTDTWDEVLLAVEPGTMVSELKRRALAEALGGRPVDADDYVVKLRGAEVFDEEASLATLGVPANAPLIILPRRRQPVR